MAYAEKLENKVIGAISGFKNGTKTVLEVTDAIKKLREANPGLADDYNKKLLEAIKAKENK
jgi:hypothetical protein